MTLLKKKSQKICIIILSFLGIFCFQVPETRSASEWTGGPYLGMSPHGVIGCEIQNDKIGFTIGIPTSFGFRFYPNSIGYRWFFCADVMQFKFDEDETIDNVTYDTYEKRLFAVGFGYKWRWKNHWELSSSLSITFNEEERSNDNQKRTEDGIGVFPGITFGYMF